MPQPIKKKPKSTAEGVTRTATKLPSKTAERERVSRHVDERIESLEDWRTETLAEVRSIIQDADADIIEECKWKKPSNPSGVPVWSHAGIVCTAETYKQFVKLTFARGAFLDDPTRLFNSSLEGNLRRAIDIGKGEKIDAKALKALIVAGVAENLRAAAEKKR